jgi:uracil-DNA glycosylase family 4
MVEKSNQIEKPYQFCQQCPLFGVYRYVPWQYPPEKGHRNQFNILFVGQNPGNETEVHTQIPFTGKAGKMSFRLLAEAGIKKGLVPITNLISCPTPEDRTPNSTEIDLCFPRLKAEIKEASPDLIIAFGKPCAMALCGNFDRGNFFDLLPKYDFHCKVLTTYHPSFVMRQRQWITPVVNDLKQIIPFLSGDLKRVEFVAEEISKHFIFDPTASQLAEFLEDCSKGPTAYDLETTGLDPRRDDLLGVGFCREIPKALCVDLPQDSPLWEIVDRYLQDKSAPKRHQNGQFDCGFIYEKRGYHVQNIAFDPMLAGQLLHSDLPNNLQDLRCTYTNIPAYKRPRKDITRMLKEGTGRVSKKECCWDVITTQAVTEKMEPLLTKEELRLKQELLLPLVYVLNEMEHKGVLVDQKKLGELFILGRRQLEPMEAEFANFWGLNPNSPKQICEAWKLKDSREETLEALIKRGETKDGWYQKLLDYRKLTKLEGTFLRGVFERLLNGRIHTHLKLDGTGTGRLASQNPNLQNVPPSMRAIYIPDPGYFFAEGDFRALELRVVGLIAPEPNLLRKVDSGIDPHSEIHALCYPNQEETHETRLRAKAIVFGTIGGRGAISIAREFGISVDTAALWQEHCIRTYPGFINYFRRCEKQLKDSGYITTPFGRRRYVSSITQGYNSPMQSTAADVTLTTLLRLYKAGVDLRVTVHDSFLAQCKTKDDARQIKEIAEQPFELFNGYCFPTKVKTGMNWFDLSELK